MRVEACDETGFITDDALEEVAAALEFGGGRAAPGNEPQARPPSPAPAVAVVAEEGAAGSSSPTDEQSPTTSSTSDSDSD